MNWTPCLQHEVSEATRFQAGMRMTDEREKREGQKKVKIGDDKGTKNRRK